MTDADQGQRTIQAACFRVGAEEYALDIMRIKEIVNPTRITPVPKAPPFIEGIIELRGAILPVVDLRKRFDLPATSITRDSKYIIVALEGRAVGLIVDRVSDVLRIATDELRAPPSMAVGADAQFFQGVYKQADRIIMLLDIDRILTSTEKIELRGLEEGVT
jgi:purine-binding chemotaxis protein CheW